MFHRPLVLVGALTAGDFALWNWSLSACHDVLALIAGLTLLPLATASLLLFALTAVQLASRFSRQPMISAAFRRAAAARRPYLGPGRSAANDRDLALDGRHAHARAIQGHATLDHDGHPASAAGVPAAKPARKLAA